MYNKWETHGQGQSLFAFIDIREWAQSTKQTYQDLLSTIRNKFKQALSLTFMLNHDIAWLKDVWSKTCFTETISKIKCVEAFCWIENVFVQNS